MKFKKHRPIIANIIEDGRIAGPQIRIVRVCKNIRYSDTLIVMPKHQSENFQHLCAQNNLNYITTSLTRPTDNLWSILGYFISFGCETWKLAYLLRQNQVNLIHVSGGSWQFKGIVAGLIIRTPTIWHLNDSLMSKKIRLIFKFMSRLTNGFIFASEKSKDYYRDVLSLNRPWKVIPSVVADEFFIDNCADRDDNAAEIGSNHVILGSVLSLSPVKNLEMLLAVLNELKIQGYKVKLRIVGPIYESQQHYKAKLDAGIESLGLVDDIQWIGPRENVLSELKKFDIYLCGSRAESSPIAVWEAMAAQIPVVSTDVGDVQKYITDGLNGFIVPIGDVIKMTEKIITLVDDKELRCKMGKAGSITAKQSFNCIEIANATQDFYDEVLCTVGCGSYG